MMVNFSESGHPIFRASSAFGRGVLRSKEGGKKAFHLNGSDENIELLLRTVISSNQLGVYGAVANLCNELSEDFRASVKPKALDYLDTTEILIGRSIAETHANAQQRKTWCKNTREFEQLSEDQKIFILCSEAGLRLVEKGQYSKTLDPEKGKEMQHLCRKYTMVRNEKGARMRGCIYKNTRFRLSST